VKPVTSLQPIDTHVFDEEEYDNHSHGLCHEALVVELAYPGIYEGVACFLPSPGIESPCCFVIVVFIGCGGGGGGGGGDDPFDGLVVGAYGAGSHYGKGVELEVGKIPPVQPAGENLLLFVGEGGVIRCLVIKGVGE